MRIHFSFVVLLLIIALSSLAFCQNSPRPNIILIMADDMGYEVPGYTGGQSYNTPNIDQLAKTGTQFTHCYSTPKCSPSRVTIMTGRYLFRTTEKWGYIPPKERTFGHMMKDAGYKVALAGKWQMALLSEDPLHIRKMGFNQFSVFGWHEGPRYHNPFIWQNGEKLENVSDQYGPDIFVNFLIDFLTKNRDKPFFAYYPTALAHDVSNDFLPPPPPGPNGKYQSYKELIEYLDKNIGKLVAALDQLGLREKTLILFTADNGTPQKSISDIKDGKYIKTPVTSKWKNIDIPGGKGLLTDYGTHVPLIANWPGITPAGKVCNDLIDFTDFMPTLADITGARQPNNRIIDGQSFAPRIMGLENQTRKWVFNQFEGKAWIRTHQWKLYEDGRLYDMVNDPLEGTPVKPEMEDKDTASIRKLLTKQMNRLKGGVKE